ncbi:MAG: hypothetical protein ACFB50_10880 [Rubrobacteraceae bacterium]
MRPYIEAGMAAINRYIGWLIPFLSAAAVALVMLLGTDIDKGADLSDAPYLIFNTMALVGVSAMVYRFVFAGGKGHFQRPTVGVVTLAYFFLALWVLLFLREVRLVGEILSLYPPELDFVLRQFRRCCYVVFLMVGWAWYFGPARGWLRMRVRPGPLLILFLLPGNLRDADQNRGTASEED